VVVVAGPRTNVRSFPALLDAIRENFKPSRDFLLLPGTAMDTLDFTGHGLNLGSKMILDATGDLGPSPPAAPPPPGPISLRELGYPVMGEIVLRDTLIVARLAQESQPRARELLESLVCHECASFAKIVAVVGEDVNLGDPESVLWGIFTRFDPARDTIFRGTNVRGACPVYDGPLGIDATLKPGYPAPLEMDPAIVERVDRRWDELFPGGAA
jgi:4-hydroxy-3-polyprenylbenzoate decarboxylase